MTALCNDCGLDTTPDDDRRKRGARKSEYYMVRDDVWRAAGMPEREPMPYSKSPGDFLCIGCLEARLGRALTASDFADAPINCPDRRNSQRLNARLLAD
jgi:hypothetical protein